MLNIVLVFALPLVAVVYTITQLQKRERLHFAPVPGKFLFKGVFGHMYIMLIPGFISIVATLANLSHGPLLYFCIGLLLSFFILIPLVFKSVVRLRAKYIYFGGAQRNLKYEEITSFEVYGEEIRISSQRYNEEVTLKKVKLLSPEWTALIEQFKALTVNHEHMVWKETLALEEHRQH